MDGIFLVLLSGQIILLLCFFYSMLQSRNQSKDLSRQIDRLNSSLEQIQMRMYDDNRENRLENKQEIRNFREELLQVVNQFNEAIVKRIYENNHAQLGQLDSFSQQLARLTQLNENKFETLRETVERQLKELREDNQNKLEEMRKTVDEKLSDTLEKRLGESFRLVSDKLEQVHKGLGEMQTLASGVGDLKKVLSNVKVRGIWGEIQLGNLLEQILAPQQYEQNIATIPGRSERVEFALKLPGSGDEPVYLPIDAKFPQEDYQRLITAQEEANAADAEAAGKALELRIKAEAKDIYTKYISVPYTTEFGIMFLPVEGLYAEVLRRPGLCEALLNTYHVIPAGPTTFAALLNSLQMGFRTLAIEKRSAEVWAILGAVKAEFGKFGDLLDRTHKKLQEASNSIDTAARKSRTIERKLKDVEIMPTGEEKKLLL